MSTDIVMRLDEALSVFDNDDRTACCGRPHEVSDVDQTLLVCNEEPFLGEDGPALQLEHIRRCVP